MHHGFPHGPGRQTLIVFGGIRHPFLRDSVTRTGRTMPSRESPGGRSFGCITDCDFIGIILVVELILPAIPDGWRSYKNELSGVEFAEVGTLAGALIFPGVAAGAEGEVAGDIVFPIFLVAF